MGILGMLIMVVGAIVSLVAWIWFLVVVFKESVLWGILLFVPFVGPIASLYFLLTHWDEAKSPFLTQLGGAAIVFVGWLVALSAAAG